MTELELEFSPPVARALDGYAPLPDAMGDWQDVLRRTGMAPSRLRRRWFVVAGAAAALLALSLATPLGGAIRDTVIGFSDWLRGTPGEPVSAEEQRAFEEENARSYVAFPGSPELRRLTRTEVDGVRYDLFGFRSGNALCLRIVTAGAARGSTLACAPVDDLRHDDAPVRILVADWPVGQGDKMATVGFDTYRAPRARVSAGIAADGVKGVELVDANGSHRVDVLANSFLYVAARPDVAQRVTDVRAHLVDGSAVGVPFAVAPWGPGGGFGGASGEPGGPTRVGRVVRGGSIGWLDRREQRGEPADGLEDRRMVRGAEFARVLTPDPENAKRVAVTISTLQMGPHQGGRAICSFLVTRGGTGGGCSEPDKLFQDVPFTFGWTAMGAGDQYATFSGLASDDVARLELYTATGDRIPVPLRDNAYLADVALARLPAKMVAYDAQGRVIGIRETPSDDGPATPVGAPIIRLSATASGDSLELVAYRTKEGGQCWFGRGTGNARVNVSSCVGKDWRQAPIRLGLLPDPPLFVYGRVRDDVKQLTLRYADGDEQQTEPERDGYVLFVIPPEHRTEDHRLVEFEGIDAHGKAVARQRLPHRNG